LLEQGERGAIEFVADLAGHHPEKRGFVLRRSFFAAHRTEPAQRPVDSG